MDINDTLSALGDIHINPPENSPSHFMTAPEDLSFYVRLKLTQYILESWYES